MATVEFGHGDESLGVRLPDGRIMEIYKDGRVEVFTVDSSTSFAIKLPPLDSWEGVVQLSTVD